MVLIPFPYTDLSANKTRPAVVISGPAYHTLRTELLLAYVSSQIVKATPPIDFLLRDWRTESALSDIVQEIDFLTQSPHLLQTLAERTVLALAALAKAGNSAVDLDEIRRLL